MGQTSSQIDNSARTGPDMDSEQKSGDQRRKVKEHKKKSMGTEQGIEKGKEKVRTSSQMQEDDHASNGSPPAGYEVAISRQVTPESSQLPTPRPSYSDAVTTQRSGKSKKGVKRDRRSKKKRRSSDIFMSSGSERAQDESGSAHLPSTPPGQTGSPPLSPYRPNVSQAQHALDEVPTDDETALFDEEFGGGTKDAEPSTSNHDIFSFSQQPLDDPNQTDSVYPELQLPLPVNTTREIATNARKRKRHSKSAPIAAQDEQTSWNNGAGQSTFDCGFGHQPFDTLLENDRDFANPFGEVEGSGGPIDPEFHSISTLPPAVDLSAMDNGSNSVKQSKKRRSNANGSSQPKKRRRIGDGQSINGGQGDCDNANNDRENMQDHVLPGLEDMQRRSSPELGTPFLEEHTTAEFKYQDKAANSSTISQQKGTRGLQSDPVVQPDSSQNEKQPRRTLKQVSEKGGQWTEAEIAKLDRFRDQYCDANRMNDRHFNSLIQSSMRGSAQVTALFNELHEVVPYRPRMSLQKFARRRFHNFTSRGTWTEEDDEMLERAVKEKGKSWKAVGKMIERMPEDCRDRWRNYHVNSEHRNREKWTEEEVKNLCSAVLECIELMKVERREAREEYYGKGAPEVDVDSDREDKDVRLINWQAVSDRMGEHGGGRSRLQCSLKWSSLKKAEQSNLLQTIREAQGLPVKKPALIKNPWRAVRASRKVANMKTGDRYTLLQAIMSSNAPSEANLPWKKLGDDAFQAIWTSLDKKMGWKNIKETIPGFASMDYHDIANRLLLDILADGKDEIHRRWDPRLDGDVSWRRRKRRSDESIRESDDEDDTDVVDESQDHYEQSDAAFEPDKDNRNGNANGRVLTTGETEERDEDEEPQDSDHDSLFNDPIDEDEETSDELFVGDPREENESQPQRDGSIGPELESRIHLLENA